MDSGNKIHFHTIDALRFFAFLKIYLLHIPLQGDLPVFAFLKSGGGIGVSFFFVLSGFLITYLLAYEKTQTGNINLGQFLLRRSFRIWPLYFLWVSVAFLIPAGIASSIGFHMTGGYVPDWKFSFFFLENYNMLIHDGFPLTTPLPVFWSLCIEEHFYLLWMLLLWVLPLKRVPYFLTATFALAWLARYFEPSVFGNRIITANDLFTNIDFFGAGGLIGYFTATRYQKICDLVLKIPQYIKYGGILAVITAVIFQKLIFCDDETHFHHIFRSSIMAIMFAGLICIFIPHTSTIRIGNKNIFSRLGVISYGLYVYHIIFIHITFQYFINHNIKTDNALNIVVFIMITFTATAITSIISYRYFELPFLQWRNRIRVQ